VSAPGTFGQPLGSFWEAYLEPRALYGGASGDSPGDVCEPLRTRGAADLGQRGLAISSHSTDVVSGASRILRIRMRT
jgi:hypothetical protein